jgi:hypothetical protein
MELEFPASLLSEELLPALQSTFEQGAGELRLDLPQEWSLFWKLREGESRVLVAHPSTDQWVGTLALEKPFAEKLIARLLVLSTGQDLRIGSVAAVSGVSNLELTLKLT